MTLVESQAKAALAASLRSRGLLEQATQAYVEATRLNPADPQLLVDLGSLLVQRGLDEAAEGPFTEALRLDPNRADASILLGNALFRRKRFSEALTFNDRAVRLAPRFAPAHYNRGNTLHALGRHEEAVRAFDRALSLEPDHISALSNKGGSLVALGRIQAATACLNAVEAMRPGLPDTSFNLATLLFQQERYQESAQACLEAIRRAGGEHPPSEVLLANMELAHGDLYRGLRRMEARKRLPEPYGVGPYRQPEWLGGMDIAGKTLLIHAEGGLGDTIHFSRYLPELKGRGARVILACQAPLRRLISTLDPDIILVTDGDTPPPFDYHCSLLSLPVALDTRLETIPASIPYLSAEQERVARWRERVGPQGFKIGIAWKGSKDSVATRRNFPVACFKHLAQLAGVRLISLQKGDGSEELNRLPRGMVVERLGDDFDAGEWALLDTAAVMQSLDLVITADTSIAHLAGALGRPTWVPLGRLADWRWFLDRMDSPWYPTMRLFRQKTRDDWDSAFAAMEAELAARLQG